MIVINFLIISVMRVVQAAFSKVSSIYIKNNKQLYLYDGYKNVISALFGFVLLAIGGIGGFNLDTFIVAFLTGISLIISSVTQILSLKYTTCVFSSVVANAGVLIIPSIVGIFLFDQPMSIGKWLGVLAILLGAFFSIPSEEKEDIDSAKSKQNTAKGIKYLVLCFLFNGAVPVLQTWFSQKVKGNTTTYTFLQFVVAAVCAGLVGLFFALKDKKVPVEESSDNAQDSVSNKKRIRVLALSGALLAIAVFFISQLVTILAEDVPSSVLFSVLTALTLVITAIVGRIAFKEKLTKRILFGLLLCIIGVALTSL